MSAIPQSRCEVTSIPATPWTQAGCVEVDRTWMIIDLVNSTSWYVSHDQATAFSLLRACLERMTRMVKKHEGTVVKLTGDGLHACFDSPLHALLCAAAYQDSTPATDDPSRRRVPGARIGLSVGSCTQCRIGGHVDYYGYAVLLATRLAQYGRRDEVVMSEDFVSESGIADALKSADVEPRLCSLKGLPYMIRAYRFYPRRLRAGRMHDKPIGAGVPASPVNTAVCRGSDADGQL